MMQITISRAGRRMIRNDDQWMALTDAFHSAAIGAQSWGTALEGLAQATGSRSGQLIGIGSNAAVPFNFITNADRRVALSTVRVQIKRILAKLGVKSQIELVARLNLL